jgi:lipoprotein-anchoring transpeptidase ErfK/SrfK
MSVSSLEHKTVRPGSLIGYSYYHSNRRPLSYTRPVPKFPRHSKLLRRSLAAALVLLVLIVGPLLRSYTDPAKQTASDVAVPTISTSTAAPKSAASAAPGAAIAPPATNHCAGNKLDKFVLVSISQRHLWACQGSRSQYDSPVITGMQNHDSTLTPPGTYHIYAKQSNVTLTGSDVTGNWNDAVQYWMPFLYNQYGTYGFHDATWRPDSAFGNVSPTSSDASHGCVELPLAASKWLYNWVQIGTAVTIKS